MPTVTAGLKPLAVFPTPKGKNRVERVSVFPAEHWEKWGGSEGLYRVLRGDSWVNRPGERHSFFTLQGVAELVRRWAVEAMGGELQEPGVAPDLPRGSGVLVSDAAGRSFTSFTRTEPFQDAHGEWRVWVVGLRPAALLEDLTLMHKGGAS